MKALELMKIEVVRFLIKVNTPKCIREQLKRYQIFTSLINEKGKQKAEFDDCCFIYALKMSNQFTEEVLNQIKLCIQNNFLPIKYIKEICYEFKIHLIVHYISDDRNIKYYDQTLNNTFIGVSTEEAKYIIEMNLFRKHYFIEETTLLSCYYIKNFKKLKEEDYMKEYWCESTQ